MLAEVVYLFGILFQVLLLFRGWRSGSLNKYPYFYAYILTSFLAGSLSYAVFVTRPASYPAMFWPLEFLTLFIGCGLVLEIFRDVLSSYPGAERFAKSVCVITFVAIFLLGLVYSLISSPGSIAQSEVGLERNVRAVQILFFVAIVGTIFYYGIALGKNIRGMIYGYGLYLAVSVVAFALRLYYHSRVDVLRTVRPMIFDVSLLIWLVSLWAYHPNPKPAPGDRLEEDYEAVASLTKARINALRGHLGRSTRG